MKKYLCEFIGTAVLVLFGCGSAAIAGEVLGTRQSGLPSFYFADLTQHSDLLQLANEQADLLLKEDPLFIDRTVPYATAFGLETEFLNKVTPLAKDRKAQYIN